LTVEKDSLQDAPKIISIFVFAFCGIYAMVYIFQSRRVGLPFANGSSLRHWPPGTNSKSVRAAFFCAKVGIAGAIGPARQAYWFDPILN
jgi:hypothetical protein